MFSLSLFNGERVPKGFFLVFKQCNIKAVDAQKFGYMMPDRFQKRFHFQRGLKGLADVIERRKIIDPPFEIISRRPHAVHQYAVNSRDADKRCQNSRSQRRIRQQRYQGKGYL